MRKEFKSDLAKWYNGVKEHMRRTLKKTNFTLFKANALSTLKKLPDKSIDLLLTDPPYNLGNFMKERKTNLSKMRRNFFGAAGWDNLEYDDWVKDMDKFFHEISRVMKVGSTAIIFMSILRVETIVHLAEKYGFYYKTTGIWHKTNPMPRNMNLQFINSTETWIYLVYKKRTGNFFNKGKVRHDFVETSLTPKNERSFGTHPTQKPLTLMTYFIELFTKEGDFVLDPFMGSGSTGVGAVRTKRQFIGSEINERYFDIASRRISHEADDE